MKSEKKGGFTSSVGFVLSAAGSVVGVGNIWRFPYLAAKDGGGLFILIYLILVFTFGFTLLTTDIAIGRRTGMNAVNAYGVIRPQWGFLGKITFIVPVIIMTYYSVIGGWVTKYIVVYLTGAGKAASEASYFTDFITAPVAPIVFMLIFLAITAFIVYCGVEKGIEKFSKIIMPGLILMIIGISIFSLTLKYTDAEGITRTGLQGLAVYLIPNFNGMTIHRFLEILLDAMSQIFFSLSVSMGIMITYGSYVKKDVDLNRSVGQIEIFDTCIALLAGMMIIPAVYVFSGTEGMASGPSLMFVSLPKVISSMGAAGNIIGFVFFLMVAFAALTSCISIMETLVASCMEIFHANRKKVSGIISMFAAASSIIICLGYNIFYVDIPLPNGTTGQLLDIMDYISNSFMMPFISFLSCIFIGWIVGDKWIEEEMEFGGHKFRRKKLYHFMIRYVAPVLMLILFIQSTGISL